MADEIGRTEEPVGDGRTNISPYREPYRVPNQGQIARLVDEIRAVEGSIEARKAVLADNDPVISRGQEDLRNDSYEADGDVATLRRTLAGLLGELAQEMPPDRWVDLASKLIHLRSTEAGDRGVYQLYELPAARDEQWIPDGCREEPAATVLRADYARWRQEGLAQLVKMVLLPAGIFASASWLLGPTLLAAPYIILGLIIAAWILFPRGREYAVAMWGAEGVHRPFKLVPPGQAPGASATLESDDTRSVLLRRRLESLEPSSFDHLISRDATANAKAKPADKDTAENHREENTP